MASIDRLTDTRAACPSRDVNHEFRPCHVTRHPRA
jgi:hypothetical protein